MILLFFRYVDYAKYNFCDTSKVTYPLFCVYTLKGFLENAYRFSQKHL